MTVIAQAPTPGIPVGGAPRTHYFSGFYYGSIGTLGTQASAVGNLYLTPVSFDRAVTLTRIAAEVTGAGGAGSVVRLGIFKADGPGGAPGTLILDAGTIDGTSVTIQEITINQPLAAGDYWLGAVAQVGTLPTLRAVISSQPGAGRHDNNVAVAHALQIASGVVGALAANPAVTLGGSSGPRVLVKVA